MKSGAFDGVWSSTMRVSKTSSLASAPKLATATQLPNTSWNQRTRLGSGEMSMSDEIRRWS